MARNLLSKYVWLIDTLRRRGRMTRRELDVCWSHSAWSTDTDKLCRRTFYNYRNAIADLFDIHIECDPATFEYYIADDDGPSSSVTDWLLNSTAVNDVLSNARSISDRIILDNIPSARDHLGTVLEAIRTGRRLKIDYHSYNRPQAVTGISFEPYLARIFRQRWYVVGREVQSRRLKTYALDRIIAATVTGRTYTMPATFDPARYFDHSFGIVVNDTPPERIVIKCDYHQAKYLRALPLHHSQDESLDNGCSLFSYTMQVTDDLVNELLSYGPRLTVVSPPSLRQRMRRELRAALANYD